jgi:hypothetical protein
MKRSIFIIGIIVLTIACSTQHNVRNDNKKSIALKQKITQDSIEYDLIIFDIGFESWFAYNDNETMKRSKDYYKHKNQFYVIAWNNLYRKNNRLIDCDIEYETNIDYGFDLNYKLYMYFKYFEEKNHLKLIN